MSHLAIGPQIYHQNYASTFSDNSKIVDIPYAFPSSAAAGPKDNWAENKPGTADLPTNPSKAKRFKKSKKLVANHEQKAYNDQTDKDYIGTATLPNHPRQG